jgi:hypothetical protein
LGRGLILIRGRAGLDAARQRALVVVHPDSRLDSLKRGTDALRLLPGQVDGTKTAVVAMTQRL